MRLEYGLPLFYHPAEGMVFSIDAEALSDLILRKEKRFLEFIRVEGGNVVVGQQIRQGDGSYESRVLTFSHDELKDLNKVIAKNFLSPRFRLSSSPRPR